MQFLVRRLHPTCRSQPERERRTTKRVGWNAGGRPQATSCRCCKLLSTSLPLPLHLLDLSPRPWLRSIFSTYALSTTRSRPLWNACISVKAVLSGLTFLPLPSGRNVRGMTVGESESELCRERLPGRGRRVKRFAKNVSRNHVGLPALYITSFLHFFSAIIIAGRSSFESRAPGSRLVAVRSHERKASPYVSDGSVFCP